jgi:hypothetical protein
MAFLALVLILVLMVQILSLSKVLAAVLVVVALFMTPINFARRASVMSAKNSSKQLSSATRELIRAQKASRERLSVEEFSAAIKGAMVQTLAHYKSADCSAFAEEALGDLLNINWSAVETGAGFGRDASLGLIFKGQYLGDFPENAPVSIKSWRSILFVPLSVAVQKGITQIETTGSVVVFNDGDPSLDGFKLSIQAGKGAFVCDGGLPLSQVRVMAPRMMLENTDNLQAVLPEDCDDQCRADVKVYNYRSAFGRVLEALN